MTPPTPKLAAGAIARAETGDPAATAADTGPFVLNLCSSTTPMALAQTDLPELKRFTFFVSRRFEEGRERFRLHMGYFATLAEAEEWLGVVREIYPGAWAGEAPGKKLRARAAAAAAAQAQHAVGPQPSAATSPPPATRAAVVTAPPAANAPIISAAPVRARVPAVPAASAPAPAPVSSPQIPVAGPAPVVSGAPAANLLSGGAAVPPATSAVSAPQARSAPSVPPVSVPTLRAASSAPGPVVAPPTPPPVAKPAPVQVAARAATNAPAAPGAAATRTASPPQSPAGRVGLTATSPTQPRSAGQPGGAAARAANTGAGQSAGGQAGAPRSGAQAAPSAAAQPSASTRRPAAAAASRTGNTGKFARPVFEDSNVKEVLAALDETSETGETRMMPGPSIARVEASDDSSMTDTQVLRFLENRREGGDRSNDSGDNGISLLKPDDTGTRRALKEAVAQNAPVSFAVQLQWSVQPVELDKVPPLAIFSAYTLYTVEGSRDGRKWYGLRLGFFSDAISAKQVAHYVRSEFASVAVVPVSPQERTRATEEDKKAATLNFPKKVRSEPIEEFKLIDPEQERANELAARSAQRAANPAKPAATPPKAPAAAAAAAPAAPAGKRGASAKGGGGKVGARERRGPQTLEETLEILGASELEIDSGRGETLNDNGVRHLRVQVQKNTPFTRLLERLSERIKKP